MGVFKVVLAVDAEGDEEQLQRIANDCLEKAKEAVRSAYPPDQVNLSESDSFVYRDELAVLDTYTADYPEPAFPEAALNEPLEPTEESTLSS